MQENDRRELRCLAPERCESIVESFLDLGQALPKNKRDPFLDAVKAICDTAATSRKLPLLFAVSQLAHTLEEIEDDHFREFIRQSHDVLTHAHEKYDSVEDIKRELKSESPCLVTVLENLVLQVELFVSVVVLTGSSDGLLAQKWLRLAKTPKQFNTQLNLYLGSIRTSMKKLYGVLSHRLQVNRSRDKELWRANRRSPMLSFGQLGLQFGMSSGAALLAYRRQARREVVYLKSLGQAADALYRLYQRKHVEYSDSEGSAPSPT